MEVTSNRAGQSDPGKTDGQEASVAVNMVEDQGNVAQDDGTGAEQQDSKKKRKKKVHDPDEPPKKLMKKNGPAYFDFPWLFLVPDGTGDTLKKFDQFPEVFNEKFKIKFEEAYIQTKGWKPTSSYGTISNNPDLQAYRVNKNEGRWCLAEGMRLSSRPFRYTNAGGNTDRDCDSCSKEGRPCGKFKKINGEFFIVFSPRAEQDRPNCQWTDSAFWFKG